MMKKLGLKSLVAAVFMALSLSANAQEANVDTSNVDLSKFRFDLVEMQDIASPTKLKHRIFYAAPQKARMQPGLMQ